MSQPKTDAELIADILTAVKANIAAGKCRHGTPDLGEVAISLAFHTTEQLRKIAQELHIKVTK